MQTQLIKEIIYCSNDTITDRIALMRPVLISFTISVLIVALAGVVYSYNVPTKELLIILFSMMVTCGLVQKIKKNPVIFISPFTMIVLSIIGMINEPNSNNWLIFQILSMMVINVIGSTRCNVINFLLVVLGPYIASFYGADMQTLYGTQIVLWALFPALLYSSYYRALFTIEKLNNLKHLHDLELKVVNEDKNAQLAQISSLIAHEVNNALAILVGNLHLIRKRYPDSISLVEKAEKNSTRIQEIVSLIKRKSYKSTLEKREFDLSSAIKDEISFLEVSLKNLDIAINSDEVVKDIKIFANETEVIQVVSNLISNARDALKICSKDEAKTISVSLNQLNQEILLEIFDNGCGIPLEHQTTIFQEGFTTKEKGEGTGLGLYFIKGIIEKNNGEISFKSSELGTTFKVRLPCL